MRICVIACPITVLAMSNSYVICRLDMFAWTSRTVTYVGSCAGESALTLLVAAALSLCSIGSFLGLEEFILGSVHHAFLHSEGCLEEEYNTQASSPECVVMFL